MAIFEYVCPQNDEHDVLDTKDFKDLPFAPSIITTTNGRKNVEYKLENNDDTESRGVVNFYGVVDDTITSTKIELNQKEVADVIANATYSQDIVDNTDMFKELKERILSDIVTQSFNNKCLANKANISGSGFVYSAEGNKLASFDSLELSEINFDDDDDKKVVSTDAILKNCYSIDDLKVYNKEEDSLVIMFGTDKDHIVKANFSFDNDEYEDKILKDIKVNLTHIKFVTEKAWPSFENIKVDLSNDDSVAQFISSRRKYLFSDNSSAEEEAASIVEDMFEDF